MEVFTGLTDVDLLHLIAVLIVCYKLEMNPNSRCSIKQTTDRLI